MIENNARVGALVAREVARLEKERISNTSHASYSSYRSSLATPSSDTLPTPDTSCSTLTGNNSPNPSILVFGSAAIDITSTTSQTIQPRTTTPGQNRLTPGGVGRNIAEACQNLSKSDSVLLISPIGFDDALGNVLSMEMRNAGLREDGLIPVEGGRTGSCTLVLEKDGDLVGGVADMGIVEGLSGDMVSLGITAVM